MLHFLNVSEGIFLFCAKLSATPAEYHHPPREFLVIEVEIHIKNIGLSVPIHEI